MANPCSHFRHLHHRVSELSRKFVDDQATAEAADPIGFQVDLDRLAAFRLLVHAEIEHFLEAKAKENIDRISARVASTNAWMRGSPELLPMAIALGKPLPSVDALEQNRFNVFVAELISGADNAIRANNGVKERAFHLLSICAGKTIDEIDQVLSASLNSYGKDRGDVAHKSVTHSRSIQAPSAEQTTAHTLVQQLGLYFDVSV